MGEEGRADRLRERLHVAAGLRPDGLVHRRREPGELVAEELDQHLLAALEIAIDIGLGETGARGDGIEPGARRSLGVEELGGGPQQLGPSLFDLLWLARALETAHGS